MVDHLKLGNTLFSLKKFNRIIIDKKLQIVKITGRPQTLFPVAKPTNIGDFFDAETLQKLQNIITTLKSNDIVTLPINTSANVPLEVIIISNNNQYELIYCDTSESTQLLEQLAIFYRYFQTTPIAIAMTDTDGNILEVNPSFLQQYGYNLKDVIGENPRVLKSGRHAPQLYDDMWQQISDPKSGHWTGEIINRANDGTEITVMLSISAVRKTDGTLQGYIASAFDISKRKRQEEQLKNYNNELKDLNALKSELTAITSHDLKAPINSIISRINLIKSNLDSMSTAKITEHLDKMVAAGKKMGDFINQLLDMEKIEAGRVQFETERLHLDTVLYSTIELNRLTALDKLVTINYEQKGHFLPLRADRMKLEQIFNNILSNAINYAPSESCINVFCQSTKDTIQIDISDQGPGIPTKEISGIFDRYSQVRTKGALSTRVHGSGLGLNIVKKYIEMHNGTVTVKNNIEKGCTFTITIKGRGKISSSADISALFIDSHGEIYSNLEPHFKKHNVCCYVCETPQGMQRIIDHEHPEVLLVGQEATSVDGNPQFVDIFLNGSSINDKSKCFQTLQTPILDIEVQNILSDIIKHNNKVAV